VASADAVIENFSPRVMEAFGLGDDVLADVNPQAVVVRMPAFGLDGPWRDRVGFAPTMEQLSGMAWLTGYPDGAPMAPRGACDPLAGLHAAFA
jgi:crotonobetainyl-CoA:carnitine CoA-transferase CaiB-like acyl-CoA transferase